MLAPTYAATVLVVEDDNELREVYRHALAISGYRVAVAADGLMALMVLEQSPPDLLVLDLGLPNVSGWDVYKDLRSRRATGTLPIIIVTGQDVSGTHLEGVARVLRKPVDPFELAAAVDHTLHPLR